MALNWGRYGLLKRSYPKAAPRPSFTPRYLTYDDEFGGAWRDHRYFSPAFIGGDVIVNVSPTKKNALDVIFPERFYTAAKEELAQLVKLVPPSASPIEAKISWYVHTLWCIDVMLLASNVYPQLWSDAIKFAFDPKRIPPTYGWGTDFDWIAKQPLWKKGRPGTSYASWAPYLLPLYVDKGAYIGANGMNRGTAYTSWYADEMEADNSDLVYSPSGWMAYMPWASLWQPTPWTQYPKAIDIAYVESMDADGSAALGLLLQRAAVFGGLGVVRKNLDFVAENGSISELFTYLAKIGSVLSRVDYWAFVRGGCTAWKWRVMFQPYQATSTDDMRMALSRQDMREFYHAHMDARTVRRRMQAVGAALKVAKVLYKAIQGDLYGTGKAYYDLAKWSKQQERASDDLVPPDRLFFQAPPVFIRGFKDAEYRPDVVDDQDSWECDASGACEGETGTAAMYVNFDKRMSHLEKLLGTWIWNYPDLTRVTDSAAKYLDDGAVKTALLQDAEKPSILPKVFFGVCAATAVALVARRYR